MPVAPLAQELATAALPASPVTSQDPTGIPPVPAQVVAEKVVFLHELPLADVEGSPHGCAHGPRTSGLLLSTVGLCGHIDGGACSIPQAVARFN